jgi:hypothetical protein
LVTFLHDVFLFHVRELVKENLMGMGYMEVDKLLNIIEESEEDVK